MERDVVDEDFLSQIEAIEAKALDYKRRKIMNESGRGLEEKERTSSQEGAYVAALKGSKSETWQQYSSSSQKVVSNRSSVVVVDNGSGGGTCFKCGKLGHWARECTEGGDSLFRANDNSDVDEKACPCGVGACLVLTANTEKNRGRKFYKCPAREESGGCRFFEWCDNTSATPALSSPQYSVSNTAQFPTRTSSFPDVPCPCGAGICLILTAKTEKNMGQQFYRCPANQENKCDFFKWCIERKSVGYQPNMPSKSFSNTSSSINKNSSYGEVRGNSCYKCGQDGHWAKDCNEPSSASPGFDVGGNNKSAVSGTCFKCGVAGHWAKDCVMKASPGSGGGGSSGDVAGKGGASCYKCYKPGHWAKDCPGQGQKVSQRR